MSLGDAEIDPHDLPFLPPPDRHFSFDLPTPLSVNSMRRFDFSKSRKVNEWKRRADMMVMAGGGVRRLGKITGKFEIKILLDDRLCRLDADNAAKMVIDYCRRLNLIVDDSKKYMRRVVIEWGNAPTGCRISLREIGADVSHETGQRA